MNHLLPDNNETEHIWLAGHRFDYLDGPHFIVIWPHGDEGEAWLVERTNCDDASVPLAASVRDVYGLPETPIDFIEIREEQTTL